MIRVQEFNACIRRTVFATLLIGAFPQWCFADGYVWFRIYEPPVRIGSTDGPIAESPIVAQSLVGADSASLHPVGEPSPLIHGSVWGKSVLVVGLQYGSIAALQIAAWDSSKWGFNFNDVPAYAIGKSSIGSIYINLDENELPPPQGIHSFFVPVSVPEPNGAILLAIGGLLLLGTLRAKRV
jgi:hypothetical protein